MSFVRSSQVTSKVAVPVLLAALLATGIVFIEASPANAAACSTTGATTAYAGGAGTSSVDPYLIATAEQLALLSATREDWGKHFKQTSNISLAAGCEWTPIAPDYGDSFSGVYDGGGHTITGLSVNQPSGIAGMFGRINGASALVKNLGLKNVTIRGAGYVGSVAGWLVSGRVETSYATGSVTGTQNTGGLVGYSAGVVENSYSKSVVTIVDWPARPDIAKEKIGGFTGSVAAGSVSNSYSIGLITDSATATSITVGGFSGQRVATVTNAFWDTESSGRATSASGTGKSSSDMKTLTTFNNTSTAGLTTAWLIVDGWEAFNFSTPTNFWGICSSVNDGYPFLLWEYSTDPCPSAATAPAITSISPASSSGTLSVAFTAPTSDGGAAISNYKYSIDNGATWVTRSPSATTSPLVIQGLTNGTSYQIKLLAINSVGDGAASTAVSGTPADPTAVSGTPAAPTAASASTAAAPAATSLATTGTSSSNYLALVPLLLALGGLFVWLGRGRRSKSEPQ